MKTASLLLALGTLLGTAQAQTTQPLPAQAAPSTAKTAPVAYKVSKPLPALAAPRVAATSSESIGRKFIEKSKPTGSRTLGIPIQ